MKLIVWALLTGLLLGCSRTEIPTNHSESQSSNGHVESSVNAEQLHAESEPWPVDFRNFTYPKDCLGKPADKPKPFTLRNGGAGDGIKDLEFSFSSVRYADVTNDGRDEALVVLAVVTGGSALPHCLYVFERNGERIEMIYDRDTGDRASDGLRRIDGESGELVIEQYTDDDGSAAAAPKFFIRRRFYYSDGKFSVRSEERFPNPDGNAAIY